MSVPALQNVLGALHTLQSSQRAKLRDAGVGHRGAIASLIDEARRHWGVEQHREEVGARSTPVCNSMQAMQTPHFTLLCTGTPIYLASPS